MTKGWKIGRLDSVITQFIVPQRDRPKVFDGDVPWCRIEDFDGVYLSKSKSGLCVSQELIDSMPLRVYPKDTVIVSCSADLGRCAIIATPLITNQTFIGLVPSENIDSLYLYYLMGSMSIQLNEMASGATIKYLSKKKFQELEIPIPPLQEQKQIVAILDQAFEAIDQAKANIEKNIQNAKELFQSKLNDIFSQKGEGWEEKSLLDLCHHKSQIVGGPFGSNLKVNDYKESGVPILRIQNIGKGYFIDKNMKFVSDEKAEELNYHSFVSGDIVLAKLGIPIGKTCIVPENYNYGILTADVVRIRPNKDIINYSFLKHFLNSQNAVKQLTDDISGATRPRVNMPEVRNLKLSVPSIEKQIALKNIIDGLESDIHSVISNYEVKTLCLENLKKSILQKAFAGELTAKDLVL